MLEATGMGFEMIVSLVALVFLGGGYYVHVRRGDARAEEVRLRLLFRRFRSDLGAR
jgi:hypothetical protein